MHLAFSPGASASISVTSTTASVALTGAGSNVRIVNAGASECFVKFGDSTVQAATTDMSIPSGAVSIFSLGQATHVAAICGGTDTTTLRLTRGEGA